MTKILFANGCSWTNGNGVEFDPRYTKNENLSYSANVRRYAWPTILASKLNYICTNRSLGGGSNSRIVRTTCDFISSLDKKYYNDLLVVIGWTTIDRREIFLKEDSVEKWITFNPSSKYYKQQMTPFSKILNKEIELYHDIYTAYVHQQMSNYTYFFQEMLLLSSLLENLNIKYLFFSSLPWNWTYVDSVDPEEKFSHYLTTLRRPNIINFRKCDPSLNIMLDFCNTNNLPFAPDHHTMIDGHRLWADHLHNELLSLYGDRL